MSTSDIHITKYNLLLSVNNIILILVIIFWLMACLTLIWSLFLSYGFLLVLLVGSIWFHLYFIFQGNKHEKIISKKYMTFIPIFIFFTLIFLIFYIWEYYLSAIFFSIVIACIIYEFVFISEKRNVSKKET